MSANVEGLVREGINAIKAGRKEEGKALLLKATELDQYNSEAWLWLSGTMDSLDDQRTCLENVLAIEPDNQRAKQGLEYLAKQAAKPSSPFTPSSPSPLVSRATSTSVEWSAPSVPPTPSWSPTPTAKEPTDEDLDAWVSNLNLPTAAPAKPGASSPFTDFNLDDDFAAGGPFGAPAPTAPPEPPRSAPPPPPASTAPRSPTPADSNSFGFADEELDELFNRSPAKAPNQGASILYDTEDDADSKFLEEEENAALFGQIPGEIKPTRIPGTRERTPFPLILVTVLLVILNIGAAALLMIGLLSV